MKGYKDWKWFFFGLNRTEMPPKVNGTFLAAFQRTEHKLSDLSDLRYSYATLGEKSGSCGFILVVTFEGKSGFGCRNNEDAAFMAAVISAGIEAWSPTALILDLKRLEYAWGD